MRRAMPSNNATQYLSQRDPCPFGGKLPQSDSAQPQILRGCEILSQVAAVARVGDSENVFIDFENNFFTECPTEKICFNFDKAST